MVLPDHQHAQPGFTQAFHDMNVSFEFFPPKSEKAAETLWQTVDILEAYDPDFVSVTYGAGGSTQETTLATVAKLNERPGLKVASHLTCVGASKDAVKEVAEQFLEHGITRIVALRGDGGPPGTTFEPHPQGYKSAADLVSGLKDVADFDISVAAYPEVHPDAVSADADIDNLKRKLDAGANRAITQFFFRPEAYFRFRDKAAAAGITAPILPGILPINNFASAKKFADACGATMPDWMLRMFAGLDDDPATRKLVAMTLAAEFCSQLYAGGVRDLHFYTLNRAELTAALCHMFGRSAAPAAALNEKAA